MEASQEPQHGEDAVRRGSNDIDLPEFDINRIDADRTALERAGNTKAIDAHPVTGVWEQIEGGNGADFGPGGYERSIIMLNPATKVAAVYRIFRGAIVFVMGGELALEIPQRSTEPGAHGGTVRDDRRSGVLELRVDPSLSSKFPQVRMPLGGDPPRFAEPPSTGGPWRLDWRRETLELVLEGKRYTPTTLDVFESLRRGGGDVATAAERIETAPTRPSAAASTTERTKEAAFFGVRGGGKRFVFIVDISGSMAGSKLDRLKAELSDSIRALDGDSEFSIVFFAGGAHVIDQGWMQARTDRDRAIQLIAQQGCNGGTDPTEAFNFAFKTLSPVPDCVFFMTDGQIPPWIPDHVRALNAARIPSVVHSIVVGAPPEEPAMRPIMERIANENQGTYTFVPQ